MTRNGLKRLWKCLQRLCKLQKVFRSICSVSANSKKFFRALAAFPQTPKSFSRHLRDSRKRQKVFRGLCSVSAKTKKFFGALAASLQTPKSFSGDLQQCCRHFQKYFGRYNALSKTCSRDKIRDLILTPNSRLLSSDQPCFPHKEQEQIAEC